MPRVPLFGVGKVGFVPDLPPHELPPEAWSDVLNVRFRDGRAERVNGHTQVYGTPTVNPYWALFCPGLSANFWLYAGSAKVYAVDVAGTHTDMTRTAGGDYSMDEDLLWNGGILGGIPVINNGVDTPQYWATIETSTKLDDLSNWPANATCRVLRPFKNFLIALDYTDGSSNRYPHRVKWSHSADPGTVPNSWDETDDTKDAGENDLTDIARGFIVDGRPLGDVFIIYKQASIWGMQFIGGNYIFRFISLVDGIGAYSKHCISPVATRGLPRHFVFTGDDLIIFDGRQADSILTDRAKTWLLDQLDDTNLGRAFCQTNFPEKECWFCFPTVGFDWPNKALVWNWEENTLYPRDILEASYIAIGDTTEDSSANLTWNSDSDSWDSDTTVWTTTENNPNQLGLVQCAPDTDKLYKSDDGDTLDGTSITSYVERTGLAVAGQDRSGQPKVDYGMRKLVHRVWPRIIGGPVELRVGYQEELNDTVSWSDAMEFDPANQKYADFLVSGRLIAVRFSGVGDNDWKLTGYDLEIEPAGIL